MMTVRVTVTKILEDWWGAEDCLSDLPPGADPAAAIRELIDEDLFAFIEGAEWTVEIQR